MLEINAIDVFYDGLQALASVSLKIRAGEFVSILGPNGAGKSTWLQTIAGLLVPRNGEIRLLGEPIHALGPHQIVGLGISLIPEEGWLFPQMDVTENLLMGVFPKTMRDTAADRMDFVFRLFPILKERHAQQAQTLSGGERQMLAIGRGLMASPRLLMLDEPSLGLAPLAIKAILGTLATIHQEQTATILLAEQNVHHALMLSQRGYVLENGNITMEDESQALLENPHIRSNYLGL